eukprot:TRINITY_DN776083_c0_g1_i1.p1 TRINITY_DN776083_c0_g1~~TRINITY_DN776083_c0_g1_i1.p1  ORF type:complete len:187 (+),score=61.18 TRINITY_DN776083_c0_g1_i1:55-615(+)
MSSPSDIPEAHMGDDAYINEYLDELNNENIVMYITRSKNKNIVMYEGMHAEGVLDTKKPIDGYWLDIDPAYREKARKKGKMDDRIELRMIEKKLAYGYKTKPTEIEGEYELSLVSLPERTICVKMVEGRPRGVCIIAGKECYITKIYVNAKESMIGLPKPQFVLIYGIDIATGEVVIEKLDKTKKK